MKNLRKVIAVRHGEADDDTEQLTEKGRIQTAILAQAIRQHTEGISDILLLTSPEDRAVETASIISARLGKLSFVIQHFLRNDEFEEGVSNKDEVAGLIKDHHQIVIIVTHSFSPSGIIHGFSMDNFRAPANPEMLLNGQGLVLCMESGDITRLP
jgi:phosphohistidine phosphatase SixA